MTNKIQDEMVTGWDARQGYTWIMCELARDVARSDWRSPEKWFESLRDFYDWVSPIVNDNTLYQNGFDKIESLIYSNKDKDGKAKTKYERSKSKKDAYDLMRKLFRYMQSKLWKEDMYVPRFKKKDPAKAMMDMDI